VSRLDSARAMSHADLVRTISEIFDAIVFEERGYISQSGDGERTG